MEISIYHEKLARPLSLESKILNPQGKVIQTGDSLLFWQNYHLIPPLLESAFGGSTQEWLDLSAIPIQAEGGTALFCMDESGGLLGFIHGYPEHLVNGPEGLSKWVLSVLAAYPPGKGIGSILFEQLKKDAKSHGAEVLFVRTDPFRQETMNFYKKHGCKEVGRIENYYKYGSGRSPAVWLMVELTK